MTALLFDVWSIVESTYSAEGNPSERIEYCCNNSNGDEL
jgi:hypothetical protein